MKKILFFLLFNFSLNAQTLLSEPFSSYPIDSTNANLIAYYLFDDNQSSYLTDRGPLGKPSFTANNTPVNLQSASVFVPGDSALGFNGTNQWLDGGNMGANFYQLTVRFYLTTRITAATSFSSFVHLNGTSDGIWLGASTGLLSNEIVSVFYPGSSIRTGWTSATDSLPSGWNVLSFIWDGTHYDIFLNGIEKTTVDQGLPTLISPGTLDIARDGGSVDYWAGAIYDIALYDSAVGKQAGMIAKNWVALNNGVTRKRMNGTFDAAQGVVSDTIYYALPLTAGSWTVALSDSAASGVAYQVLTSADATTWTTLASGTTGTSWGGKSYSGAGTGYVAIAVASGTAFFDDLVVTLASDDKNGFGGYSGKYKGWGKY